MSVSRKKKVLSIVAAVFIYTLYTRIAVKSNKSNKSNKEIPVPSSAYPYIGHLLSLGRLPSKNISEWHREFGPIIKLFMGAQTWISVDDPILAHKIFVTHGIETSYRPHSTYAYYHYSSEGK